VVSHAFLTGHGGWTVVEDAALAPLLAVISFVCSVGNIPLAAALWANGVAFGGVISFIFADLVILPLLLIYRRFYGTSAALRLFALLWLMMSGRSRGRPAVQSGAHDPRVTPHQRDERPLRDGLDPRAEHHRRHRARDSVAARARRKARRTQRHRPDLRDDRRHLGPRGDASSRRRGLLLLLAALRRAVRPEEMHEDEGGDRVDPVCSMRVDSHSAPSAIGPDGITYYFCSDGCRTTFLAGSNPAPTKIELGRKPSHE
jgi:YHS domain-containing protein